MNFSWHVFINLGVISFCLLLATFLRSKVKFFQKYLIPNALTAGFIALPLYNFVFPNMGLDSIQLGQLTYHFLGLSFIALSLRKGQKRDKPGQDIFPTSVAIISQMILQCILGIGLTLIFIATLFPDLYHSFGFLLPLGFGQGPGQAYSIGGSWEAYGVDSAASIGLTFAAIGFVLCCFGGIFLINHAKKRGWVTEKELELMNEPETRTGIVPRDKENPSGAKLTTETEAIDSFSLHIALVLAAYFTSFLLLKGIGFLLSFAGDAGQQLAANLWGINFIFAAFMGLALKSVLKLTKTDHVTDNQTLTRISGLGVDIMVTSAVAAISLTTVANYWLPLIVTAGLGAITTFYATIWFCSRLFHDHRFLRTLLIFGVSTGTLSTGLALLRAVDPEFESPVAVDYTYASGITFFLLIPLILIINLPLQTYVTGDPKFMWITWGVLAVYLLFVITCFLLIARKKAVGQLSEHLYFREEGQ